MADSLADAPEGVHAVEPATSYDQEVGFVRDGAERFDGAALVPLDRQAGECLQVVCGIGSGDDDA